MTTFADISHHQSTVDLAAYATVHDRVVLKATEGTTYTDPTFAARWRQAGSLNLARVAYHFARNANTGSLEFDHFLSVVDSAGIGPRDWLCLDTEDTASPGRAVAAAQEFTARAVQRGYANGLVYTGRWYAEPNGLTADAMPPGWRRLWLSDYTTAHSDTGMPLPTGWTRAQVVARQHTSTATVTGITGPCDYSRVLADWLQTTMAPGDDNMSAEDVQALSDKLDAIFRLITVGDSADDTVDPQTHRFNLQRVLQGLEDPTSSKLLKNDAQQLAALTTITAQLAALTAVVGGPPTGSGGWTPEQAHQIALEAAREAVDGITVTVHGEPV